MNGPPLFDGHGRKLVAACLVLAVVTAALEHGGWWWPELVVVLLVAGRSRWAGPGLRLAATAAGRVLATVAAGLVFVARQALPATRYARGVARERRRRWRDQRRARRSRRKAGQ